MNPIQPHTGHDPFADSTVTGTLWLNTQHRQIFATLALGVQHNKGLLMLTGAAGTGKTTLVKALIRQLRHTVRCAMVNGPELRQLDLFQVLAEALELPPEANTAALNRLHEFLSSTHSAKQQILVVIDDAHQLTGRLLEQIRLLASFRKYRTRLLNILLVGRGSIRNRLQEQAQTSLQHRIAVDCHMTNLGKASTDAYIRHRLKLTGQTTQLFESEALQEIFAVTNGNFHLINRLCSQSMSAASQQNLVKVSEAVVRRCADQLQPRVDQQPEQEPPSSSYEATVQLNERSARLKAALPKLAALKQRRPTRALAAAAALGLFGLVVGLFIYEARRAPQPTPPQVALQETTELKASMPLPQDTPPVDQISPAPKTAESSTIDVGKIQPPVKVPDSPAGVVPEPLQPSLADKKQDVVDASIARAPSDSGDEGVPLDTEQDANPTLPPLSHEKLLPEDHAPEHSELTAYFPKPMPPPPVDENASRRTAPAPKQAAGTPVQEPEMSTATKSEAPAPKALTTQEAPATAAPAATKVTPTAPESTLEVVDQEPTITSMEEYLSQKIEGFFAESQTPPGQPDKQAQADQPAEGSLKVASAGGKTAKAHKAEKEAVKAASPGSLSPSPDKPSPSRTPLAGVTGSVPTPAPGGSAGSAVVVSPPQNMEQFLTRIDPAQNRQHALLHALQYWVPEAQIEVGLKPNENDLVFFQRVAGRNGLVIHPLLGGLDELRRFNLPAILEFQLPQRPAALYATLTGIEANSISLASGGQGATISVKAEEITPYWSGAAYIPWKNLFGQDLEMIDATADATVVLALKKRLRLLGFKQIDLGPVYDDATREAVKQIQAKYGLITDGVVGLETQMALYCEQKGLIPSGKTAP